MNVRRIAIISYNWPPRNAIGTHRPYAWAKYWAEQGVHVTVLTAKKQAFDAPLDLALPAIEGVEVLEIDYATSSNRISDKVLKSERVRRIARKLKLWLRRQTGATIDLRGRWRTAAADSAKALANRVDVVISTFGPAAGHLIACDMKRENPGLRWIADYRDLWSQNIDPKLFPQEHAVAHRLETETVGRFADMITAVSEDMVSQLHALTAKPTVLIPNGFDLDEGLLRTRLAQPRKPVSKPLKIVYTGMLYDGERDPEPLLMALTGLHAEGRIGLNDVSVIFYGARIDRARRLAERPEYAPFIRIIGHVPREEALEAQGSADLLLLLGSPDPKARGVLTGKVFEYLSSGTPILCLGSLKEYELPKLLAATGTGISLEQNIDNIKKLIGGLSCDGQAIEFYKPDLTQILLYSRRRQALTLLAEIFP